jgi:NADH:ubiquinone oxidoreductase subunit E
MREGIPVYKVKDYAGDPIVGTFYSSELQHIKPSDTQLYKIEKILKKRKQRGKVSYLVRWLGWSKEHDSWVREEDIEDINDIPQS